MKVIRIINVIDDNAPDDDSPENDISNSDNANREMATVRIHYTAEDPPDHDVPLVISKITYLRMIRVFGSDINLYMLAIEPILV